MSNTTSNASSTHAGVFLIVAIVVGFFSGVIFYEADVFWQDTGVFFGLCLVASVWGFFHSSTGGLHHLYWRTNPAIGAARLGVLGAMAWCIFVLVFFADPTITGIWTVLYFLMAYSGIKLFGQLFAERYGPRLRIDVYERKNLAAGTFIGSFTFATGLIMGGAMWGEMTPESLSYGWLFSGLPGYEDGWWITPWFFAMGWLVLVLVMWFWFRRERANFRQRVVQERAMPNARAASYFCVACGITIAYAVQGDYTGFFESLFGFSFIALPILAHEILRPRADSSTQRDGEGWIYIVMALAGLLIMPWLADLLGLGLAL